MNTLRPFLFIAILLGMVACGRATPITPPPPTPTTQPTPEPTPEPEGKRIVAYYTAWSIYGRKYQVEDIPADLITHINYAFANIEDGECVAGDAYADKGSNFPGLIALKQQHPHLQTLLSVGGWTWSKHFSDVALTDATRQKFAAACVAFMVQYGFDGLDIDWEYPVSGGLEANSRRPEDRHNFTLLLAELRRQLDEQGQIDGKHYLLTIAAAAPPSLAANLELDRLPLYLDWINVMTYDFHTSNERVTNFHSALYAAPDDPASHDLNVDTSLQAFLDGGVPPEQLVMGIAFYGRGWAGVTDANNGLFQPATRLPQGTWDYGLFDYKDLAANYVNAPGYTRYWHETALVPWLYNPAEGITIIYDDPESIRHKAEYILAHNLGGAMFWELSGDDTTRPDSLLVALHEALNMTR